MNVRDRDLDETKSGKEQFIISCYANKIKYCYGKKQFSTCIKRDSFSSFASICLKPSVIFSSSPQNMEIKIIVQTDWPLDFQGSTIYIRFVSATQWWLKYMCRKMFTKKTTLFFQKCSEHPRDFAEPSFVQQIAIAQVHWADSLLIVLFKIFLSCFREMLQARVTKLFISSETKTGLLILKTKQADLKSYT